MVEETLERLNIGTGAERREIAIRSFPGSAPGIFWLGGFKSDMKGTKAEALAEHARNGGRAYTRFDYSGHGESGGDFRDGTISRWAEETRAAFYVRMKLPFGATFRDLDAKEREAVGGAGVQLGSIVGGSPASRANLLAGDIVVAVDGAPVSGKAEFQKLLKAKAGKRVSLTVWRGGVRMEREVRLGVPTESKR